MDEEGYHCGTLYGIDASDVEKSQDLQLEFILLSATRGRSRTLHYADPDLDLQPGLRPDASGPLGHYEGKVYEQYSKRNFSKEEARWSTLNVLLVSVNEGSTERLAIGQIHVIA